MSKYVKCYKCGGHGNKNGISYHKQRYRCTNPECPAPSFEYDEKEKKYYFPYVKYKKFTFDEAKLKFEEIKKILEDPDYRDILLKNFPVFLQKVEGRTMQKRIIKKQGLERMKNTTKRQIDITKSIIVRKVKELNKLETKLKSYEDELMNIDKPINSKLKK